MDDVHAQASFLLNFGLMPKAISEQIMAQKNKNQTIKMVQTRTKRKFLSNEVSKISQEFLEQFGNSQTNENNQAIKPNTKDVLKPSNSRYPANDDLPANNQHLLVEIPSSKKPKMEARPVTLTNKRKTQHKISAQKSTEQIVIFKNKSNLPGSDSSLILKPTNTAPVSDNMENSQQHNIKLKQIHMHDIHKEALVIQTLPQERPCQSCNLFNKQINNIHMMENLQPNIINQINIDDKSERRCPIILRFNKKSKHSSLKSCLTLNKKHETSELLKEEKIKLHQAVIFSDRKPKFKLTQEDTEKIGVSNILSLTKNPSCSVVSSFVKENKHQAITVKGTQENIKKQSVNIIGPKINTEAFLQKRHWKKQMVQRGQSPKADKICLKVVSPSKLQATNHRTDLLTKVLQPVNNSPVLKELQNLTPNKEVCSANLSSDEVQKQNLKNEENKENIPNKTNFPITTPETREQPIVQQNANAVPTNNLRNQTRRNQSLQDNSTKKNKTLVTFQDFKESVSQEELDEEMANYNPRMARSFCGVAQTNARIKNTYASRLCRARVRIAKRKMKEKFENLLKDKMAALSKHNQ